MIGSTLGAKGLLARWRCLALGAVVITPSMRSPWLFWRIRDRIGSQGTVAGPMALRSRLPRPVGQGRHPPPEPGTV